MAADAEAWADAYRRQAAAQWALYRSVADRRDVPPALRLHLLQMATENDMKQFLLRGGGRDFLWEAGGSQPRRRHQVIRRGVKAYLDVHASSIWKERPKDSVKAMKLAIIRIAELVDHAHPQAAEAQTPNNCEYPWLEGDKVVAPVDRDFQEVFHGLETTRAGHQFLKIVQRTLQP